MELKEPFGAVAVLVFVTAVAFVEVWAKVPWSPLLLAYGILIIAVPLALAKRRELGFVRPLNLVEALVLVGVFFVTYWAFQSVVGYAYQLYLASLRGPPPVLADLPAAQQTAVSASATKAAEVVSQVTPTSPSMFLALIPWATLAYAPIGEELFYRGFGYVQVAQRGSFLLSSTLSSVLFALRHSIQLFTVTPIPWIAALYWFGLTLPFGYLACYILKRTGSVYPAIALHFFVNLASTIGL